jgi:uncharacterized protein
VERPKGSGQLRQTLGFENVLAVVRDDLRKDYSEDRYNILGMANGRLLYVSYTFRQERIRIISARGTEPYEKRLYHEANA